MHGREKRGASVGEVPELVVSNAEIDVRFDPVRSEFNDVLIIFDGARQSVDAIFAVERRLEKIFGSRSGHGMQFGGLDGHVKRESPLAEKRIERAFGPRRNDVNFTAQLHEAKFLHRNGRRRELCLDEFDRAANAPSGNVIFGELLNGAKGEEIAETVETFAPAGLRFDEPQTFPVAETARLKS